MEKTIDMEKVQHIMAEIISTIDHSKNQLLDIVENARIDFESVSNELSAIKVEMERIIAEVDRLSLRDKMARTRLAEVSKAFNRHTEGDIKKAYENATDTKIALSAAEKEEQMMRIRRTQLEIALKRSIQNIQNAEHVVHQVTIAVTYLKGEIMSAISELGADDMVLGVKILEAQENERLRISRDIHDGPAQQIASIVMKADYCDRLARKDIEAGLKELSDLKEQAKRALVEVRAIIHDLRPMSLEDLGLNETIEAYVFGYAKDNGLSAKVKCGKIVTPVESIIKVAVYRLVQEVLNNIKKHSKCHYFSVQLEYGSKYLRLIIVDDGVGFHLNETLERLKKEHSSYGLLGLYERVRQLGGEIAIVSTPGQGVSVSVKLPVNREVNRRDS